MFGLIHGPVNYMADIAKRRVGASLPFTQHTGEIGEDKNPSVSAGDPHYSGDHCESNKIILLHSI